MSTSTSRGLALAGADRDLVLVAAGVDDGPGDPVLDAFESFDPEFVGEDHLVTGRQAVGLVRQLDAVLSKLARLRSAVLGEGVHLVALFV